MNNLIIQKIKEERRLGILSINPEDPLKWHIMSYKEATTKTKRQIGNIARSRQEGE
jgi:hypothetical protein